MKVLSGRRWVPLWISTVSLLGLLFHPTSADGHASSVSYVSGSLDPSPMLLPLEPLVSEVNWNEWYQRESGYLPDPAYFGAYVTLAHQGDLYIGLGSARPAENSGDGALLVRYDGDHLEALGPLTEQGVHELVWDTDRLHIAGTDPCCGDDWSAGNHYVYNPPTGAIQKYRDPVNGLVEVLHTWGLWVAPNRELYGAVSANHGGTRAGELYTSVDSGETWTKRSDLGGYRLYDIVGFEGKLYGLYNDLLGEPLRLAVSEDSGLTWTDVLSDGLHHIRLTEYQDSLLAVSFDRQRIYRLQTSGLTEYELPAGVTLGITYPEGRNYDYNLLAVGDGYLYTIWESSTSGEPVSTIVRTLDLQAWDLLASTQEQLISLSYWPEQQRLIASSNGEDAALWQVRVSLTHRNFLPFFTRLYSP